MNTIFPLFIKKKKYILEGPETIINVFLLKR